MEFIDIVPVWDFNFSNRLFADGIIENGVGELEGLDVRYPHHYSAQLHPAHPFAVREDVSKEFLLVDFALLVEVSGVEWRECGVGRESAFSRHCCRRGGEYGHTAIADGKDEPCGDVVLTCGRLAHGDDMRIGVLGAFVGLEGFVLEFGTECTTQRFVLDSLVLMEHADDAGIGERGDGEEFGEYVLRLLVVVDIAHDIAYAIEDDEVGLVDADSRCDEVESVLPILLSEVIDRQMFVVGLVSDERCDAGAENLLGGVLGLLGIDPEGFQGLVIGSRQPHEGRCFRERHQDRCDVGLARFGFTGECDEFSACETWFAVPLIKESVGSDLGGGGDTSLLQSLRCGQCGGFRSRGHARPPFS